MNIRQQKYKSNRIAGMNQYNAARAAGYSEKYSRQACRLDKLVTVSMADAFEQAGLTDKVIVQHALEGLMATKHIQGMRIKVGGEDEGLSAASVEVPDWASRHKYFETISKMTNRLKEKLDVNLNKTEKILIIRYDEHQDEKVAGRVRVLQEAVSGDVVELGNGKEHEPDIAGHALQRADT